MVEEKLKQLGAARTHLSAKEEVTTQAAVEVLHHRAGADDLVGHFLNRSFQRWVSVSQSFPQGIVTLPVFGLRRREGKHLEDLSCNLDVDMMLTRDVVELLIDVSHESQQVVSLVFEAGSNVTDAMARLSRQVIVRPSSKRGWNVSPQQGTSGHACACPALSPLPASATV